MTDTLTHALTIHQPWAWAVAAGHKPVENRTWRPPLEAVGQLIGIHASANRAKWTEAAIEVDRAMRPGPDQQGHLAGRILPEMADRDFGALIGVARLVGVLKHNAKTDRLHYLFSRSDLGEAVPHSIAEKYWPWWRGPWGWFLEEAVLLPEPIPMRGQQGLWRIPLRIGEIGTDSTVYVRPGDLALEQWRKARETR